MIVKTLNHSVILGFIQQKPSYPLDRNDFYNVYQVSGFKIMRGEMKEVQIITHTKQLNYNIMIDSLDWNGGGEFFGSCAFGWMHISLDLSEARVIQKITLFRNNNYVFCISGLHNGCWWH